jgi:hypothetical protein
MYLQQQNITFQLVPPYNHRRDSAEGAIISFKDHLIAELCSTDKSFPMHLWDRLLLHAVITLNMLRTSIINPKLSAATHIYGQYIQNPNQHHHLHQRRRHDDDGHQELLCRHPAATF